MKVELKLLQVILILIWFLLISCYYLKNFKKIFFAYTIPKDPNQPQLLDEDKTKKKNDSIFLLIIFIFFILALIRICVVPKYIEDKNILHYFDLVLFYIIGMPLFMLLLFTIMMMTVICPIGRGKRYMSTISHLVNKNNHKKNNPRENDNKEKTKQNHLCDDSNKKEKA